MRARAMAPSKPVAYVDPSAASEWPVALASDLQLGAIIIVAEQKAAMRPTLCSPADGPRMTVLELNKSRSTRRPLLVLLQDGSFDSLEYDFNGNSRVRLVHAALTAGEDVVVDRAALEYAGWVSQDGAGKDALPTVRSTFSKYVVMVNNKEVVVNHRDEIHGHLVAEMRRGQPEVMLSCKIRALAPPEEIVVPIEAVSAMSDVHRSNMYVCTYE